MQTKITQLDKVVLNMLRKELQSAVDSVAEKFGLKVEVGSCTYTPPSNATFRMSVSTIGEGGVVEDKFRTLWKKYAHVIGLNPELLDSSISYAGRQYKVVGLNPNRDKMPVLVQREDGKRFFVPTSAVNGIICDTVVHQDGGLSAL